MPLKNTIKSVLNFFKINIDVIFDDEIHLGKINILNLKKIIIKNGSNEKCNLRGIYCL